MNKFNLKSLIPAIILALLILISNFKVNILFAKELSDVTLGTSDINLSSNFEITALDKILDEQNLGSVWPMNPIKYAIRNAIKAGIPANTIVMLLLLPLVAAIIAAARHLIGVRGFGIFLPAALSIVFVSIGPIVGIGLFLVIVLILTSTRMILRLTKIRLQYLPRMALLLLFVVMAVLAVLFASSYINKQNLTNISIFPVLILVLLSEDFSKVQSGKSVRMAINITTETLILALISYLFLTLKFVQKFAILYPETLLFSVAIFDFFLGKYVGLRFVEYWRFRSLISG